MNNINLYLDKNYIQIHNNSEKYIEQLKIKDRILIKQIDLCPSDNLLQRNDPLWCYYYVKYFKIDEKEITPESVFPNYVISCGDCFMGECYLIKRIKQYSV